MASSFKGDKLIEINGYMLYIDGFKEKPNKELYYARAKNSEGAITWSLYSLELAVKYLDKLSEFEEANKKALRALKSIISLENQKRFKDKTSAEDLYDVINETYNDTRLEEVDIDSLISDLLLEEARIGTSADLKANKAFKNNVKYCSHCKQKEHLNSTCFKLHPELKPNFNKKPNNKAISAKDKDFKNGSSKALMSAFTNSSSNSELNHFGIAYSITNNNEFVLDSGASEHYSLNKAWFINYKPIAKKSIIIANGDIMLILSINFVLKTIDNSEGLFKAIEQNLENCESCVFKLDNAREFTSNKWITFCKSKGIICEYTSPYSPSQNGIAERLNRYLIERLISLRVVEIEEAEDQPYFDDTESRASDAFSDLNTDDLNKVTVEAPKALKTRGPAKDYSDQRPNVITRSSKNNSFNLAITELNNRLIEEQIQAMSVYKNIPLLALSNKWLGA
ncbi:retrotransposon protein, putative, Ty1-copia subclass [Drepanopeziza brunnea f. sp. 'multigermtubi' MB_m1]|uniref:Retrotransposon protein, putative, Ty1-copia subclass n=1 Tax=Marssonina brunnea f. sp. multigermtubi (strain MB_m1) TaxID=1072389 RepID=K1X298_MARBU|nr:retrotransposon protein, putative, Ty1-copia subclass [Drepanopeziza brunnea f. sp. 'multigermtubi' MB_m1]EKD19107.1 retrotransposon protein, putative, Ty1-copia subclass [Drepanopeziza brunnea f. sp. 'multigermtubi' MB_m1]